MESMNYTHQQAVASELIVNDRTLALPAPPLSLTTSGDLVWIALSDGKVEVRNARTGEVVRRFDPAAAATRRAEAAATPPTVGAAITAATTAGILSNLTNRVLAASQSTSSNIPSILKKRTEEAPAKPAPAPVVIVRSLLAVPVADGSTHVWLGLSNGSIEVHEGGDLLHSSVGAVASSPLNSFRALLRKHSAAVTCLAEFGGFVYSGGEDQHIIQWRASQATFVSIFQGQSLHQAAVRCLFAEGNAIVSGSDDCTVKVWDAGEGVMRLTGYFHSRSGGVLSLCRVGELMWSGDAAGQVVRWHIRSCEAVGLHAPHRDRVLSLCHVGDRVYSGSADGTMGIFAAATGQLLQLITDQALGWVTAVACPAELSRFVLWSASADGAVRCWYQDEYASMSADAMRFNDASWYESGSTPYREFRAAVGQRTNRLKRQLEAVEQRDQETMALLRRCSTVFGGGVGSGADFAAQQQRLQMQLAKAEERNAAAEARQAQRRDSVNQLDRDIAAMLALLQGSKNELNQLLPGEAERILAAMPSVNAADLIPYGQGTSSGLDSGGAAPPAPSSTYAAGTAVPTGPPSALAALPPPPTSVVQMPLPPAATASPLGVGGPLSTTPPPPPPPSIPPPVTAPVPPPPPSVNPPLSSSSANATGTGAVGGGGVPAPTGPPPPPAGTTGVLPVSSAPQPTAKTQAEVDAGEDLTSWTNPHVGNYIQRRYYGASPSLRTIDLMKEERRRGRLPRVKVEPLQRGRSQSAAARAASKSAANSCSGGATSAVDQKKLSTTTVTTAVKTTTVTSTTQRSQ